MPEAMPEAFPGAMPEPCPEQSTQRTQRTDGRYPRQNLESQVSNVRAKADSKNRITRYHVDADYARELRRSGLSIRQTAELLGCSARHVTRLTGVQGPKAPIPADVLERALPMLRDGASYLEVSRTLGVSYRVLAKRFPGFAWSTQQRGQFGYAVSRFNRQMAAGAAERSRNG